MVNAAQIMIVENESTYTDELKKALERLGYLVVGITRPDQPIMEKALRLKADVILMDLMFVCDDKLKTHNPAKKIYSAFRTRNSEHKKILPVIYLTNYLDSPSSLNEFVDTEKSGYCCLLRKPFTEAQLKNTIDFAINGNPGGSQNFKLNNQQRYEPFSDILGKYSKDLICLIKELKTGSIAELSLNLIIKVCFELARANVKKKIARISNVNKRWELSVEDVAVESICNLFIKNSKHRKLNLECFLNNWTDTISDNTDALFFLNKVVNISIDQYINKLLRESDPYFAKTIDTFYIAIKKMNYCKLDHFGTVYIVKDGTESLPPSCNLISSEELKKISLNNKTDKKELLNYLMNYIEFRTEYFPAIPLNPLVEKYMDYNHQYFAVPEILCDLERISVDDIIFGSLEKTISKMKKTYLKTNKLSIIEADCIASALTDIAFDFREGNTIEQLPDYLGVYIKNFSIEEYKEKYRNIFEYLVKIFKRSIAGKLKQ